MKILSVTRLFLLLVILLPMSLSAGINKNKIIGNWNVSAVITSDVYFKNWSGTLAVQEHGKNLVGTLVWSSAEGDFTVKQLMNVTVKGNTVTLQGTVVELLTHPEQITKYNPDTFVFNMNDEGTQTTPVSAGDGKGIIATFTISKS